MKKLLTMVIALITAAALFTSCGPQAGGGSDDNGNTTNNSGSQNGGGGSSGGSGNSSSGNSGSAQATVYIPYIFDIAALTDDCSLADYTSFFSEPGTYECQFIIANSEFIGSTLVEINNSQKGEYTVTKEDYESAPDIEVTKASETLYISTANIAYPEVITALEQMYETQGYTVKPKDSDTIVLEKADILGNEDFPLYPGIYANKETCKTNADKSKVYITIPASTTVISKFLIAKK